MGSDYFKKLFSEQFVDRIKQSCNVPFSGMIMEVIIDFLYHMEIKDLEMQFLFEVYKAADYFMMSYLKQQLDQQLGAMMSEKNVFIIPEELDKIMSKTLEVHSRSFIGKMNPLVVDDNHRNKKPKL